MMISALRNITVLMLLAGACTAVSAADAIRVRVLHMPYISFAPIFIAQEEGFFAAEGLAVEFVSMRRSSLVLPALIRGEVDVMAGTNSLSLFNAMAQGARIRIVAGKGYIFPGGCLDSGILMHRDLYDAAGIHAESIKGRRIGANPSTNAFVVEAFLRRYGLTTADVTIVDVQNRLKAEALTNGSVDLVYATEPWTTRILQTGQAVPAASTNKLLPNQDWAFIIFGPTFLDHAPDTGVRFMKAYLRAVRAYANGKTERNVEILVKHTGLDPELLRSACWMPIRPGGAVDTESLLVYQEWGLRKGQLGRVLSVEQFWDPSFIEKAAAE